MSTSTPSTRSPVAVLTTTGAVPIAAAVLLLAFAGCATAPPDAPRGQPAPPAAALAPLPLTDNTAAPFTAVYRGSVGGLAKPRGAQLNDAYAAWLNRSVLWALDSTPNQTWDHLTGQDWQLAPWAQWKRQVAGRRFVYNIFILPGPVDGSGPKTGWRAGQPVSLEEGAAGTYNPIFRTLAENLVRHGLGDSILRLGVEFNGGWFAWRVPNDAKARAFAGYWRQMVTTMRAVPGAEGLRFDWNVNIGWCGFDPELAWPGDDIADVVGVDCYDDGYAPGTYPWPKDATAAEIAARRDKVWAEIHDAKFGLRYWSAFAARHGKPMSLPEWGTNIKPDGHGGGDNPAFIERMHAFITDPRNNLLYHSYFDYQAGDGHHQLSPGDKGFQTEFPLAAARFRQLFSLPGGTGR